MSYFQGLYSKAGAPALLNPEDYKNPAVSDHLIGHLPESGIVFVNGQPEAAPVATPAPPVLPVLGAEQAAREAAEAIYQGLTRSPETFWASLGRVIGLGFLQSGIDPRVVRVPLPFNSGQVCAGGMSMIKAVQTDKKAQSLEVDVAALGQDVAAAVRVEQAREVLAPAFHVVDANSTVVLNRIATRVEQGLDRGESVVRTDGNLSWVLRPALGIRGVPAEAGVASRAQNARDEEAIRADEQSRMQAAAGAAEPAVARTTTVTTETPASSRVAVKPPLSK